MMGFIQEEVSIGRKRFAKRRNTQKESHKKQVNGENTKRQYLSKDGMILWKKI